MTHKPFLHFHLGDITLFNTDGIVNATDEQLSGEGGVDAAIHRAAGSKLATACQQIRYCAVGEAVITPGFELTCKHIIHTVGPRYGTHQGNESSLLARCYHNCLQLAYTYVIKSIAFPSIATGVFGYPIQQAAPIAILSCADWYAQHPDTSIQIHYVLFHPSDFALYCQVADSLGIRYHPSVKPP